MALTMLFALFRFEVKASPLHQIEKPVASTGDIAIAQDSPMHFCSI